MDPDPFWHGFTVGMAVLLFVEGVLYAFYRCGKESARSDRKGVR